MTDKEILERYKMALEIISKLSAYDSVSQAKMFANLALEHNKCQPSNN